MVYLLLSIFALIAGPFLSAAAARRPAARAALDGFVLVTIGGIVCLHIAPDAWEAAGIASVVTGMLGLVFPAVLERLYRNALARAHLVVLAVAAAGIAVHAVLDGVALLPIVTDASSSGRELAAGVIIHRLPVGMAIWWVVRPQFGTAAALGTFALVIVTTILGYSAGVEVFASGVEALALFQAFVAGSLVHVALFGVSHDHGHEHGASGTAHRHGGRVRSTAFRAGLFVGLVTVFLLPHISG